MNHFFDVMFFHFFHSILILIILNLACVIEPVANWLKKYGTLPIDFYKEMYAGGDSAYAIGSPIFMSLQQIP